MTEKEYFIKNYPDVCYGDKPLSPYWDLFQDGVEFGERQSEKKIEELEKKNAELKEQVEKMKCCENCKHKKSEVDRCELLMYTMNACLCKNKDKWEIKE